MGMVLKALTLTQPWGSLVALLQKTIETRSWGTHYRGELAIHAAKGYTDDDRYITTTEPFVTALGGLRPVDLPFGKVVAVVTLVNCYKFTSFTEDSVLEKSGRGVYPPYEADFGNYEPGRYGLMFENIIPLKQPVPARGMQGLWTLPSDVEKLVREQMAA